MGASSSRSDYVDEICEQINKNYEDMIERNNENARKEISMAEQIVRQEAERPNIRLDNIQRKYILSNQKSLGYNINPYRLSRNELRYWSSRIENEIMNKYYS